MLPLALLLACSGPDTDTDTPVDASADPIEAYDPLPWVDPLIGTGGIGAGIGAVNPGPRWPHGMSHPGPDTRSSTSGVASFYHSGGYYYPDDQIVGFSHTHAHGMGVPDLGSVLLMPRDGWSPAWTEDKTRAAPFSHDDEVAEAATYTVTLGDDGTLVEITPTPRGAVHRYTFVDGAEPVVVVDLAHSAGNDADVPESELAVDLSTGTLTAYQLLMGNYSRRSGGLLTWVHATFEPAPVASGTWVDSESPDVGSTTASGPGVGAWLEFPSGTTEVTVRLALSYVDADGAAANHAAEVAGLSYDDAAEAAREAWRAELSGVRVRGGTDAERTIFHTAHYHSSIWPGLHQDVDGRYRGMDREVHTSEQTYYSDFSLWDTFRTAHPWYILAHPDRAVDFAHSLTQMSVDGGSLPKWPLGHSYTGGMVGSPATQVLAGTWLKGLTEGWDVEAGYGAALAAASGPQDHDSRGGIEGYLERGYVAFEDASGPASRTLEFAWCDASLARWAEGLGHTADLPQLQEQAGSWANTWDAEQHFFAGRYADGSFLFEEHPDWWSSAYVEGDAWQYLWYVPYDPEAMVELQHGGDLDAFLELYDRFWDEAYLEEDDFNADSWYWHGNEPDIHYPFLASLLGRPDHSADPARFVLASRYRATPDGLDGNEDGGTLSSWYLLAATGLYPVAGTDVYAIGSPIFDRVEIDRPEGTLVVRAPGVSDTARYVQEASLGGEALDRSVLTHAELVEAGEVVLHMGTSPSGWGAR